MSAIVAPLHVGTVHGLPVRFFASPMSGSPLPWHAMLDIYAAAGVPSEFASTMLQAARGAFPREVVTVATSDGPVVIGPHDAAIGFLDAASACAGAVEDYRREVTSVAFNLVVGRGAH